MVFDFRMGRGRDGPRGFLGNFEGRLQTDGYIGCEKVGGPKLTRFLDHPELELSNNLAENHMRGVALDRQNWIHLGSREAGPKVAAILSVVETCRRMGIAAREYQGAVLPGLGDVSIQRLADLTPAAWAVRNR